MVGSLHLTNITANSVTEQYRGDFDLRTEQRVYVVQWGCELSIPNRQTSLAQLDILRTTEANQITRQTSFHDQ